MSSPVARYRSNKLLIHPVDRCVYTRIRCRCAQYPSYLSAINVFLTIYRDVTREPFRLHPFALPPENFFNSCRFRLLARPARICIGLLILLQTFSPLPFPGGVYIYIYSRRKDAAEAFIKGVNAARARDILTLVTSQPRGCVCVCVCVAFFVACSSFHYVFFDRGNFATFVPVSRTLCTRIDKMFERKKKAVLYTSPIRTPIRTTSRRNKSF